VASGLRWFELVRRRDEAWLNSKKLLTRDLSLGTTFAVDYAGEIYLVGGTAVVPADADLLFPLLGFLNSTIASWYIAQTTPTFRAGFQKIEPQHLQDLPVPKPIVEGGNLQERLTALVSEAIEARLNGNVDHQETIESEIDRIIADLVGIKIEEVKSASV
jgi:restriction endonuclease TaqI-like protein